MQILATEQAAEPVIPRILGATCEVAPAMTSMQGWGGA
jgi:hypothetical protein